MALPKKTKIILSVTLPLLSAIALLVGFWFYNHFFFRFTDYYNDSADSEYINRIYKTHSGYGLTEEEKRNLEWREENGCIVNYPSFIYPPEYKDGFTWGWSVEMWDALGPIELYALYMWRIYEQFIKLDYKIEIIENEIIKVIYFGYGYPDEGRGEPVPLIQEIIIDISNVSEDKLPTVIYSYPMEDILKTYIDFATANVAKRNAEIYGEPVPGETEKPPADNSLQRQ
ncbi:MAG: hypothetical protein FWG44_04385 [Oscillospiraceae bacterium]|nr:hypothetical protein [Oscillospiraceae bacterium]